MDLWKVTAVGALVVLGWMVLKKKAAATVPGQSALERGDPRGTVSHAAEVLTKGAKAIAEEGKRSILGETKADQRETDKKRRVGG